MGPAQVTVFGGLAPTADDSPIRQPQSLSLLTYLAVEGPKPREHLAMVFWPKAKSPLNNLSSALSRIRSAHPDWLVLDAHQVGTTVRTDADQILEYLAAEDYQSAIALYSGPFFEGVKLRSIGIELEEWIFGRRESFAAAVSRAALKVADDEQSELSRSEVTGLAERAVEIASHGLPIPTFSVGATNFLPIPPVRHAPRSSVWPRVSTSTSACPPLPTLTRVVMLRVP